MSALAPPVWVRKRGGQLEPFDADKISRALFAASEQLGRPDAFLARELADSVTHFLAVDCEGETPTTSRIAEVVVQVVGELHKPDLARAFANHVRPDPEGPPAAPPALADVLASAARRYTLETVYTRDLAAAQEAGLIALTGLETPGELAGCVLGPPVPLTGDLVADLELARRFAGQSAAVDGLEDVAGNPAEQAAALARGLRLTGLSGVVNLNTSSPPPWAGLVAEGPLFTSPARLAPARRRQRADELLAACAGQNSPALRIDWHLGEDDLTEQARPRLVHAVALARRTGLCFVLSRPRRAVPLAEGLGRSCPAVLLTAGIHLPALLAQPGMLSDPSRYVQKLGSLVRLALSAAVQKRAFVRREERRTNTGPAVTSGFLLDRARFVVVPVGLDEVVQQYTGWSMSTGGPSLELGRTIVRRLVEVLRHDGRLAQLDARLDGPASFRLGSDPPCRETVAGLTAWDGGAGFRSQLRAASALHACAEHGTAALFVHEAGDDEIADALGFAWRNTDVVRVRLVAGP